MGKKTAHFVIPKSPSDSSRANLATSRPASTKTTNSSRPVTSKSQNAERRKKEACREHSYCYKPSDPSYYPVGLPWATGKLKCIPGYCNYEDFRIALEPYEEPEVKKDKFVKTLVEEDEATVEELGFFLQIANIAGDYDDDIYDKMDAILQKMRQKT